MASNVSGLTGEEIINLPLEVALKRLLAPSDNYNEYSHLFSEYKEFFTVCAGAKHHHWWVGGLVVHIKEMLAFMVDQVQTNPEVYSEISSSDIAQACILHDFDKVWGYIRLTDEEKVSGKYHENQEFKATDENFLILDGLSKTLLTISAFNIYPGERVWSSVIFAHGGWSDANFGFGGPTRVGRTVMHENKLAVLLHMADMFSSQILGKSIA